MFKFYANVVKIKSISMRFIKKFTETFSLNYKSGNFSLSFY